MDLDEAMAIVVDMAREVRPSITDWSDSARRKREAIETVERHLDGGGED